MFIFITDSSSRSSSDGLIIITANNLLKEVSESVGINYEKRLLIKGSKLDGIIYKHPLFDKRSPVVLGGDYITTDSGTGLVHTAPGHGVDDFNTGKKYKLPICLLYTSPSPRDS